LGKNKDFFKDGEANQWFTRNLKTLELKDTDEIITLLTEWLYPFKAELSDVLEIGCGSGHRLKQISQTLKADGYGVEPSSEAVDYIKNSFPSLKAKVGFGDDVPYKNKFDLVHLGFFLYLVDREVYLRCISEADRLVKFGGFLSIIDFDTPIPYSNDYSHKKGVFSHKQNNSDVFVASGLYSVVNKFQFSHSNFFFDKEINKRVSLTLLYKETDVFGKRK
jgi:SAM-dependent methyltransferase